MNGTQFNQDLASNMTEMSLSKISLVYVFIALLCSTLPFTTLAEEGGEGTRTDLTVEEQHVNINYLKLISIMFRKMFVKALKVNSENRPPNTEKVNKSKRSPSSETKRYT